MMWPGTTREVAAFPKRLKKVWRGAEVGEGAGDRGAGTTVPAAKPVKPVSLLAISMTLSMSRNVQRTSDTPSSPPTDASTKRCEEGAKELIVTGSARSL
jgi:hypothetical protein